MKEYRDTVEQEKGMKPRLYTFPNWNESSAVFDYEDLVEDGLIVLCVRARHHEEGHEQDQHTVYICKGPDFDEEEANNEIINVEEFTQRVME